jgi:hypothetical protein
MLPPLLPVWAPQVGRVMHIARTSLHGNIARPFFVLADMEIACVHVKGGDSLEPFVQNGGLFRGADNNCVLANLRP